MNPSTSVPTHSAAISKLYSFVVGINAYQQVRPLSGAVQDAATIEHYLESLTDVEHHSLHLSDREASKTAIVAGFRTHLKQAGPNDTALFYFAGHGAQEAADPTLWPTEADGKLESIVCFDGDAAHTWDYLLTDKELRYLIAELSQTGAHVVTIFDCCHSGDNTRFFDLLAATPEGQKMQERRLSQSAPMRPYAGFIFQEQFTEDDFRQQGLDQLIPLGTHIQLAACESDEAAVEDRENKEGVFTKNLVAVLKAANSAISYQALHNRVRQYMRFAYEQRPRISAAGDASDKLLLTGFLNRPIDTQTAVAEITFNPNKRQWLLDVGAIHGVGRTTKSIQLLDDSGKPAFSVTPLKIGADYTLLKIGAEQEAGLDRGKAYRAEVEGLLTEPIKLHFINHNGDVAEQALLLKTLTEKAGAFFIPEEDEQTADYTLHVRNGLLYFSRPGDENRPLIRTVPADNLERAYGELTQYLRHLAAWQYLKELRNPEALEPILTIAVTPEVAPTVVLKGAQPTPVTIPLQESTTPSGKTVWTNKVSIQLINPTAQMLYCTVLYLSRDFIAMKNFLPVNERLQAGNYRLEPGKSELLGLPSRKSLTGRNDFVRMSLEETVRQYNWPEVTEHFKVIVSVNPLSESTLAMLALDVLPSPHTLDEKLDADENRASAFDTEEDEEEFPDWSTQLVTLRIPNPVFNRVDLGELNRMLEPVLVDGVPVANPMSDFALGLYFQPDPIDSELVLRDDLTVTGEEQRGLWGDVKTFVSNQIAYQIRNRQYMQNLIKYPDRVRLVAGGDSWFQYPLLSDIVDYLARVYSVNCTPAVGKSLKNYIEKSKFLEILAQVSPRYFLLSGGGTHFFGDEFPTYIRDQTAESLPAPQRYVADGFTAALDELETDFQRLFRLIRLQNAKVRVLVHGYDYLLPDASETQSGKPGNLEKCLTEKGITDAVERKNLIRFMIDGFNERLQRAASAFDNVIYIDLRGSIRPATSQLKYWYDEFHPNDKGFLSIATKYAQLIGKMEKERV
ncbi:caspase family protein [Larkinella sp. GY13]|uniref:caspase family protein n=1 Tax=Larkinella sp. GY13 TaxID=3453720 RepID=UPI003EF02540